MKKENLNHLSDNNWAIITGASGGLGTSFALSCARKEYHLLLIDLPGKHLFNLCDFISRNFPVKVKFLEVDLSEENFEIPILEKIKTDKIKPKILINNAGMSQNDFFENTDGHYLRKMIELNDVACVSLTKALLPELKKNKESYIINVSSFGSFYPLPYKTCYAATKGFVRQFSQALRMEVEKYGVHVSALCPGPMTTNINNYLLTRNLNWFARKTIQRPDAVAEKAIRDTLQKREIIIPGRLNRILKFISSLIPGFIRKKLTAYSMHHLDKEKTSKKNMVPKRKKVMSLPV